MKGQPGPKDVAGSVFVSLCGMPACLADEHRLGDAVASSCVPAGFAAFGGMAGIDRDADASSVLRFGAQNRDEITPAGVDDTPVEPRLGGAAIWHERSSRFRAAHGSGAADHVGDRQVLHHDQVIGLNELQGSLVVEVAPSVGNFAMSGSHCLTFARPVIGAPLGSGEPPLCSRQLTCAKPPRIVNVLTVGGCSKATDAQIHTDLLSGGRQRTTSYLITRKDQHPAAPLSPDLDRLHSSKDLAMCGDLDLPNSSQINAVRVGVPTRAVTIFGPRHTVKSSRALKARISGLSGGFQSMKEEFKRPIEPTQRGLLTRIGPRRKVRANRTYPSQLSGLIPVPDRGLCACPSIPTLLQRGIVQLAMRFQTRRQPDMLARCRPHSKFVSAPHATTSRHCSMHQAIGFSFGEPQLATGTRRNTPCTTPVA